MKVAIQIDFLHKLNIQKDSTLFLIREALLRGFHCEIYHPSHMSLVSGQLFAKCQTITAHKNGFETSKARLIKLDEFDVILMRQEPPFDMNYITSTYLLEKIAGKVLIVNNPSEVRNLPEKLFVCDFPEFMPPTVITNDQEIILDFLQEHGQIIFKPLYAFGGSDIHLVNEVDQATQTLDLLIQKYDTPVVVQKYLPEIALGDKRIMLLNGKILGAFNRVPPESAFRANLAVGGVGDITTITPKEHKICEIVGKELAKRGIIFAGLDIIGGFLTEINVTCPTGIAITNDLYKLTGKERIESRIWDKIVDLL